MKLMTSVLVSALAASGAAMPGRLPFLEDDYTRALAQARKSKLPLFVEVWAPW